MATAAALITFPQRRKLHSQSGKRAVNHLATCSQALHSGALPNSLGTARLVRAVCFRAARLLFVSRRTKARATPQCVFMPSPLALGIHGGECSGRWGGVSAARCPATAHSKAALQGHSRPVLRAPVNAFSTGMAGDVAAIIDLFFGNVYYTHHDKRGDYSEAQR